MARALSPAAAAAGVRHLADDRRWQRQFRKTYRRVGVQAARDSRGVMRSSGDRRLANSARAIRGDSSPVSAEVSVRNSSAVPYTLATVWGTKRRTGFYALPRYRASTGLQHPEWVGSDWTPATRGEGPRGINDAFADNEDAYASAFLDATIAVVLEAFPAGTVT